TKTPLKEAFGNWRSIKRVLIAFFGIMCAQGAVWYFTFFYMQVFLEKSLGLPGGTKDLLLIVMTVASAPLYVFFGWLSDRVGRKPVMLGGMLLALALYFPGSHWIADAANPALAAAQKAAPVIVETDPRTCSVQFDPVGTRKFSSNCDIAKSVLLTKGVSFTTRPSADGQTRVLVGKYRLEFGAGDFPKSADFKQMKALMSTGIEGLLEASGYPARADPKAANLP